MSYDEFNGSSFDLNDDGEIDNAEASFIEETYYGRHHDSDYDDEDDDDLEIRGASRSLPSKNHKEDPIIDFDKLHRDLAREKAIKAFVVAGILIALSIAFPDSPGVVIFVGGMIMCAKVSGVF